MSEAVNNLQDVIVVGEKSNKKIVSNDLGEKIEIKEIQSIPVIFGEKDILKTIQLLPGIQPVGEGNSGFYVRGGGTDENLILLDEAPVYNPSHLLGFFSTFNSDAVKDINVYKSGFPAEYGGRLSSVIDVKMIEGNDKVYHVSGGIGIIASRLALEGPLVKNKGSFMITARRTYLDVLTRLYGQIKNDSVLKSSVLYFYDINMKANYQISNKDKVFFSGYFGKDVFDFDNLFNINWGNTTATARWNHLFSDKMFSNTSLIFSKYSYTVAVGFAAISLNIQSEIQDWNLKEDFNYYLNTKNTIKFGFNSIYHTFVPGKVSLSGINNPPPITNVDDKYALENAIYISNEQTVNSHIKLTYGLRYSMFSAMGPGSVESYDSQGNTIDSVHYSHSKIYKTYGGIEPRILINYIINDSNSIKLSYARTRQYIHLLTNSTSASPFELWMPSDNNIPQEIADQYSLGYFINLKDNMYEGSVEVYYKNMQNEIDYVDGADLTLNPRVESQLLYGTGKCYGAEFLIRKKYGKFNGWISYTRARSLRQFAQINNGSEFDANQDRPNSLSIVTIYQISKRVTMSATFVYYSGNPVTFPSGRYYIDGNPIPYYTSRNGYRMPDYNRMDFGITWQGKKTARFESNWNFSLYNVYGRENAYIIYFQTVPNNPNKEEAVQISLFRWVPSITYNFKF